MFHKQTRFLPIAFAFAFSAVLLAACTHGGGNVLPSQPAQVQQSASAPAEDLRDESLVSTAATAGANTWNGCHVFTDAFWTRDMSTVRADPQSAQMIRSINDARGIDGAYPSIGTHPINRATSATPMVAVHKVGEANQNFTVEPWASNFVFERAPSDQHSIVVQTSACHLYEMYRTMYAYGRLSGETGHEWNLNAPYQTSRGPAATASGLPIFAGMVRALDFAQGRINHPVYIAPGGCSLGTLTYVFPADDSGNNCWHGPASETLRMPYGATLVANATVRLNCPSGCPEAQLVLDAWKHHGAIISDTGSIGTAAAIYVESGSWSDLSNLRQVRASWFHVVPPPNCPSVAACERRM